MNYEQAIKDLQDTLIVIGEIERRQSKMLREHAEMLHAHAEMIHKHDRYHDDILEFRRRTDQNLAEITDKLNGLIGYVDGLPPAQPS